ncbi:MAG: GNAT family N-acetyltransferase [Solobacterium sp.]|nr:GNAT family N-acetyltransferase [Solobacterium sp.]
MKVNLNDVIEAIENLSDEYTYYYYIPREEIVSYSDYSGWSDPGMPETVYNDDLIALPTRKEVDDYGNMVRFIESQPDGDAKEWMGNAIHGRGAFRMFRAAAERFDLLSDWYDFQEKAHRATAMVWCEENGIIYEDRLKPLDDEEEDDLYEEEEEEIPVPVPKEEKLNLRIVDITDKNYMNLIFLKDEYNRFAARYTGEAPESDPDRAQDELEDLLDQGCIIFAASDHGRYLGYIVLLESPDELRLKELFVRSDSRRKGIAGALMKKAESRAAEAGLEEVTNTVQPDNQVMISFLNSCGYNTLGMLEVHKAGAKRGAVKVGNHEFDL